MAWRDIERDEKYSTTRHPIVFITFRCTVCNRLGVAREGEKPSACVCGAKS
jgi:hypothetical protein